MSLKEQPVTAEELNPREGATEGQPDAEPGVFAWRA